MTEELQKGPNLKNSSATEAKKEENIAQFIKDMVEHVKMHQPQQQQIKNSRLQLQDIFPSLNEIVTPIDDFSELSSFFIVKNINTQSFDTLAKGLKSL